jgi:DNA-binding NtrC family response regulator
VFTPSAEAVLREWRWAGNVRELQNVVQRASLLCEGMAIDGPQLRGWLQPQNLADGVGAGAHLAARLASAPTELLADPIAALVGRKLEEVADELVLRTLDSNQGNRTKTAEVLGIGVRTLFNRLRERQQATAVELVS